MNNRNGNLFLGTFNSDFGFGPGRRKSVRGGDQVTAPIRAAQMKALLTAVPPQFNCILLGDVHVPQHSTPAPSQRIDGFFVPSLGNPPDQAPGRGERRFSDHAPLSVVFVPKGNNLS